MAVPAAMLVASCINTDNQLGKDYLDISQQYDIYTTAFNLEDIEVEEPDSLSTFSTSRICFGAIRDEEYGLTTRSSAFTLVPVNDTLDFGKAGTQVFKSFHVTAPFDTTSYDTEDQKHIIQNINVYELKEPFSTRTAYPELVYDKIRVTKGIPVFNGRDSLSFNLNEAIGRKYLTIKQEDLGDIKDYTKRFPGIVVTTDEPIGNGGRINMFKLPIDVQNGYLYGSAAYLRFSAEYEDRGQVDTTFMFYLGPVRKYDFSQVSTTSTTEQTQVAFNACSHETDKLQGTAGDLIRFEGGRGLKPVIRAEAIRNKLREIMGEHGNPDDAVVSKATIELPFEFPDDYQRMRVWPATLSPTCRIATDTSVTYAGLTDASVSSENQGDIDRHNCRYAPDVTHHVQELIKANLDERPVSDFDIWLLPMALETTKTQNSGNSDMSEYYRNLAYSQYYNSMYGGYGGYGGYGYGGYGGDYYSNYYNYMMMAQMYSANTTSTTTTAQLDCYRYYRCALNGPAASGRKPRIKVTYLLPKDR